MMNRQEHELFIQMRDRIRELQAAGTVLLELLEKPVPFLDEISRRLKEEPGLLEYLNAWPGHRNTPAEEPTED
jgi:uncharacterized iron-regulated protein